MRKNIIKQMAVSGATMLLCMLLAAGKLAAQTTTEGPKLCGGAFIDTAALNKALEFENNNAVLRGSSTYQVRVYFHILANNDGTNAAATLTQINQEFAVLGYDYSLGNICFINCGYNIINSTKLNTNYVVGTDNYSLFNPYLAPGCINLFYMQKIGGTNAAGGSNGGYGGISQSIPGTLSLIATGNIGQGQSISHEVGHDLGLLHTFEPVNGLEDINGSNSASTADQIKDTPADPWAFNQTGNTCFSISSSGGNYSGNCTDPNGQSNYSPPYTNLMAYWWSQRAATQLSTTADQFVRENSYLSSNSGLEGCESSQSNLTIPAATFSSGFEFLTSFGTISNTSGAASNFSGSVNAGFIAGSISLHPGFNAAPGSGGRVDISVTNCSFAAAGPAAAPEGIVATGISSPATSDEQIKVIPNPFNSFFELSATVSKDEKATISIYDVVGARVKEVADQNLTTGNNKISFDCSALPGGIYFVELRTEDARNVIKVVKN